ncbi:unnamed protein product [Malus baccata var. baccata]
MESSLLPSIDLFSTMSSIALPALDHNQSIIHIEGMEKLISSWYNGQTLPETYIFPADARHGNLTTAPSRDNIPMIDLGGAEGESLLTDTMGVFRELFDLPEEEKANLYFDDPKKSCMLSTSSGYFDLEDVRFWCDYLRLPCHPLEECLQQGPQQPRLGLGTAYFRDELCHNATLSVNHYPPCLDPSLTLGMPKHCDPNLITILLQEDHVNGLQVFKYGEWINDCIVEPAKALISASNPHHYKPFQYKEFFINYVMKQGKTEVY